jgi:hypothetical protein
LEVAQRTESGLLDPQAARVAISAYQWRASKLKPKKYGDKLDVTTDGQPLTVQVVRFGDLPKKPEGER